MHGGKRTKFGFVTKKIKDASNRKCQSNERKPMI